MGSCAAGACVSPLDAITTHRHLHTRAHTAEALATVTAFHDAAMGGNNRQANQSSLVTDICDSGSLDTGVLSAQDASAWGSASWLQPAGTAVAAAAFYGLGDHSRSFAGAASAPMAQARVSPSGAHLSYSTPPSPLSLDGKPHSLEGRVSNPPHEPAQQVAGVAEAAELTADLGAMGGDEEMAEEGSYEGGGGLEWRRVVAMLMSDTKHAMNTVDSVMGGQDEQQQQQQQQQQQHHDEMRNQQLSYQHVGTHQELTHYYQPDHTLHDDHEKQHPGQRLGNDTAQCHHRNWQATPSASSPLKLVIPIPWHHGETRSAANTTAAHVGDAIAGPASSDGLTVHQFQSPSRQFQVSPAATPVFSTPVRDAPLPYDPVETTSDGKPRRVPLRHCERSLQPLKLSLTEARPHDLLGSEQHAPEGWRSKSRRREELTVGSPRIQIPSRGVQMVSPGDGIASPSGLTSSPGVRMATSPGLQSPPTILLDDMSARIGRSASKRRRGHSGSWEARGSSASPGGNRAVVAEEERPAVTASPAATATPFEGPDWLHHLHSGKLQTLPIMLRMETTKDRISLLRQLVAPALTKGDTATVLGEVEQFVRAVYEKLKEMSNGHEQHAAFPAKGNAKVWCAPATSWAENEFGVDGGVGGRDDVGLAAKGLRLVTRRTAENFVNRATHCRRL